ncbi:MAG: PqqD family protein [Bacteroidales bacterium]|nr:PqqD family protein [Bacteroidales bacterium]
MRIKKGFKLREIMGEFAVIGEGLEQVNFNKIISLNSTAAYIWKEIEGRDFDADMVADLLLAKYDVEEERAISDATALVQKLVENGLTE